MELPETKTGRAAVWLAAAAIVLGMMLPISYWMQLAARSDWLTAIGPYLILAAASSLVLSLILSAVAIYGFKDRTPILTLLFTLISIMAGFFAIMLLGEFIFPH